MRALLITTIIILLLHRSSSGTLNFHSHESRSRFGSDSCTAPFLLPHKPFVVIWNHPSHICEKHGIHIGFEKWGIVDNKNDSFIGEKISLLYHPGKWPFYMDDVPYNGGIPQLGNKALHIESLKDALNTKVPDRNFSGLGVIDFEKWRPLFSLNFDNLKIYQQKSLELAKQRHPSFNKSKIHEEAVEEFEKAARSYTEDSLKTATTLRPLGQWGFYGYPRCWDANCNASTITRNDRMSWIFAASSSLFPSIYFHSGTTPESHYSQVKKTLHETLRVKAKWAPTNAAIFPYALIQDGPYEFFTPTDLQYSVQQPADMGSSGVLLWGSSATASAKNECLILQDYVNTTLGPFSKQVMDFFSNCSTQMCSGHGRCVRKNYEVIYQHHLPTSGRKQCGIPWKRLKLSHKKHTNQLKAVSIYKRLKRGGGMCNKWKRRKLWYRMMCEKKRHYYAWQERLCKKLNDFKQERVTFVQGDRRENGSKHKMKSLYTKHKKLAKLKRLSQTTQPKCEKVKGRISGQPREKTKGWNDALNRFIREIHSKSQRSLLKRQQLKHQNSFSYLNKQQNEISQRQRDSLWFLPEKTTKKSYTRTQSYKDFLMPIKETFRQDKNIVIEKNFEDYICKCFTGWSGQHCEVKQ